MTDTATPTPEPPQPVIRPPRQRSDSPEAAHRRKMALWKH